MSSHDHNLRHNYSVFQLKFQSSHSPESVKKSVLTFISKSLFNKTMYKNIGADTAGIALWKVVGIEQYCDSKIKDYWYAS